jgi:hypothetical protein
MITVQTAMPQPGMELIHVLQQAYQKGQQLWIHTRQIDTELRATQRQDELTGKRAVLDAQLTKLHQRKAKLGAKRATTVNFTKARAQARAVAAAINHEAPPRPTFVKASQNVAAAVTLFTTKNLLIHDVSVLS